MQNQNSKPQPAGNFWFGFALGASATAAVSFLLGTKKGRKFLKEVLDLSENLEENLLILGEELEETIAEKGSEIKDGLKQLPKQHHSLGGLLQKIKTLSPR